ncbi:MAG: PIG-L family deacetylase [Bryobacterales bacterium]|nr:PIG-L family deacetylase [Bryobacterales bacterium]
MPDQSSSPTRRGMLAGTGSFLLNPGEAGEKLRVVVVGGHPDDPESGCGGTIARFTGSGHRVTIFYLTRGERGIPGKSLDEAAAIRTREAGEACRILGARAVFLGQVDGDTSISRTVYEQFEKLLSAERPDIVFAQWPIDSHRDHRITGLLAHDAWLRTTPKFQLYYYEVESGRQTQQFAPGCYVNIASTIDKKRASIFAHASQGPAGIWALHDQMQRFRGVEAACKVAEGFIPLAQGRTITF